MSVTAVPIRPIRKGSVARLWIGLAALSLAAGGLAWAGTAGQHFVTTESGLQIRVVEEGEGPHPAPTDIVLIDYTGTLEDGTVFDTSEGGQPLPLPVTGSIPGFSEGLQMMRKGGTYELKIPSELAYGAEGAGGVIPPNADLEFEVTLIDFVPASALQGMGMPPPGM